MNDMIAQLKTQEKIKKDTIEQVDTRKQMLRMKQVAAVLDVSRTTVWRKMKACEEGGPWFPGKSIGKRTYRCSQEDLDKYCSTQ